jgi:hypothetical protein
VNEPELTPGGEPPADDRNDETEGSPEPDPTEETPDAETSRKRTKRGLVLNLVRRYPTRRTPATCRPNQVQAFAVSGPKPPNPVRARHRPRESGSGPPRPRGSTMRNEWPSLSG